MPARICNVQLGSQATAGAAYPADTQLGTRPAAGAAYLSNVRLGKYDPYNPLYPGSGNLVYVQLENIIGRTNNFLSASPNWLSRSLPTGSGIAYRLIIDPWFVSEAGSTVAWLACENGVWRTPDINAGTPSWTQKMTGAAFAAATGKTLAAVRNIRATIAEAGRFYAHALATDDTLYVCMTADNGGSWTFTSVGTVSDTAVPFGIATNQYDALEVWTAGADGVLKKSTDGAASFSTAYTVPNAGGPINNIELPYAGNRDGQTIYISGGSGGTVYFSDDFETYALGALVGQSPWVALSGQSSAQVQDYDVFAGSQAVKASNTERAAKRPFSSTENWHVQLQGKTLNLGGESEAWLVRVESAGGLVTMGHKYTTYGHFNWVVSAGGAYVNSGVAVVANTWLLLEIIREQGGDIQFKVDGAVIATVADATSTPTHVGFYADDGAVIRVDSLVASEVGGLYLWKSINGASTFSDVTPSVGGNDVAPLGWYGMEVATKDENTIYALCDDGAGTHYLMVSENAATSWTEKAAFDSIDPADEDGQSSLGAWPYDVRTMYVLQYRDPGGSPADMIRGSLNLGEDWASKVGDWATGINAVWGLTKAYVGTIVPVWRA